MDIDKLNDWNPWWEKKDFLLELKGLPRTKYDFLLNSIQLKEVTIITGVRRSGKSTLMYQMVSNLIKKGVPPNQILLVNLEDKQLEQDSLDDIYKTYRENVNPDKKAYIFLDEIHRKADWEFWIRKKYDLKTDNKFVISGSCSHLLKKEYSTLLTGRNLTFEVFPLSFEEFLLFKKIEFDLDNIKKGFISEKTKTIILNNLQEYLEFGGFPEIPFISENYKKRVLAQYFDDIIYKDIIDRHNLESKKVKDLALFLITDFTGYFSLRSIRNSLGISYDAMKDYLSYYQDSFLIFTVDHFSYSFKEQKTASSKIYCIDNGIRNSVSFKFSKDAGKLAENLVFLELKRRKKEIYYWKNKKEVDFIIKNKDNSLTAINVSYSDDLHEREIKSLLDFEKEFNKTKNLIMITKDLEKKEGKLEFIPLWKWLLI